MATAATVQQLMTELELLVDSVLSVSQHGEDRWVVVFEDESQLGVDLDQETAKLTFVIDVGAVSEERRLSVYETLLAYNSLYHETCGVTMAISEPGGNVLQLFSLFDPDISTLVAVSQELVAKAAAWRAAVAEIDTVAESTPDEPDGQVPSGAIRV